MSVPLRRLLAADDLHLRLLTGDPGVEVGWAHSSDLLDPTPFLERGNLLLTTGTQIDDPDRGAWHPYVERLRETGVAALGFGTEVVRATPSALLDACAELSVPLLQVPYRTPFIAIVRRVADEVSELAHARQAWTLEAQRALAVSALRTPARPTGPDGATRVLTELAALLDAEVLLLHEDGRVISRRGTRRLPSAGLEQVRQECARLVRRRLRAASVVQSADGVVLLQTLGPQQHRVLAVVVQRPPDAAVSAVVTSAVALVEVAGSSGARPDGRSVVANQVRTLLLHGHVDAARAVLADGGEGLPEPPVQLLVTPAGQVAPSPGRAVLPFDENRQLVILPYDAEPVPGALLRCRPVDYPDLPDVLARARRALATRAGAATGSSEPCVELAASPVLGLLARDEVRAAARGRLARLDGDPDAAAADTLRLWLEHGGAWEPAARQLRLHRHTLKAQVLRAGSVLGLDLGGFAGRAELWALLTACRTEPDGRCQDGQL